MKALLVGSIVNNRAKGAEMAVIADKSKKFAQFKEPEKGFGITIYFPHLHYP